MDNKSESNKFSPRLRPVITKSTPTSGVDFGIPMGAPLPYGKEVISIGEKEET